MQLQLITTVITAAKDYDLTTLVNVKAELDILDGSKDALLNRYITGASAAAAQYCNRKFQVETVQDQFWPAHDLMPVSSYFDVLQLSRWPIVSITSFTDDGTALVEDTDFVVDYDNGQVARLDSRGFTVRWNAKPKVTVFPAGYAGLGGFQGIPPDVEDAVIRMVKSRYMARGRDPLLRSENIEGVYEAQYWIATGSQAGNMTPDVIDLLDNYRVPVVV
jgi:hypothetical protein